MYSIYQYYLTLFVEELQRYKSLVEEKDKQLKGYLGAADDTILEQADSLKRQSEENKTQKTKIVFLKKQISALKKQCTELVKSAAVQPNSEDKQEEEEQEQDQLDVAVGKKRATRGRPPSLATKTKNVWWR